MRLCLVTSFPPSRGDLNEYGYHLASVLRSRVELTILADESPAGAELPGFRAQRCWRFDSPLNALRLLRAIWKTKPDVVWFNMGFSTFARSPLSAFLGAAIPALTRCMGFYTHITLHTVQLQGDTSKLQPHASQEVQVKGMAASGSSASGSSAGSSASDQGMGTQGTGTATTAGNTQTFTVSKVKKISGSFTSSK